MNHENFVIVKPATKEEKSAVIRKHHPLFKEGDSISDKKIKDFYVDAVRLSFINDHQLGITSHFENFIKKNTHLLPFDIWGFYANTVVTGLIRRTLEDLYQLENVTLDDINDNFHLYGLYSVFSNLNDDYGRFKIGDFKDGKMVLETVGENNTHARYLLHALDYVVNGNLNVDTWPMQDLLDAHEIGCSKEFPPIQFFENSEVQVSQNNNKFLILNLTQEQRDHLGMLILITKLMYVDEQNYKITKMVIE